MYVVPPRAVVLRYHSHVSGSGVGRVPVPRPQVVSHNRNSSNCSRIRIQMHAPKRLAREAALRNLVVTVTADGTGAPAVRRWYDSNPRDSESKASAAYETCLIRCPNADMRRQRPSRAL